MKRYLQWITSGLAGVLFSFGLILSGMANPTKVIAFLDVTGLWDPSLALVMGGGLLVGSIGFALLKKQSKTLLGEPLNLPSSNTIDKRLVGGAMLFGIGWGITGICPGPGLVLLGEGMFAGLIYVASLVVGMALYSFIEKMRHNLS